MARHSLFAISICTQFTFERQDSLDSEIIKWKFLFIRLELNECTDISDVVKLFFHAPMSHRCLSYVIEIEKHIYRNLITLWIEIQWKFHKLILNSLFAKLNTDATFPNHFRFEMCCAFIGRVIFGFQFLEFS